MIWSGTARSRRRCCRVRPRNVLLDAREQVLDIGNGVVYALYRVSVCTIPERVFYSASILEPCGCVDRYSEPRQLDRPMDYPPFSGGGPLLALIIAS